MAGSLYLIDGTYELFRSFFGAPARKNIAGQEVGAVAGLLASLNVLIREEKPDYIAAATDSTILSFRNDLYSNYKDGTDIDPELLSQFPIAEKALQALGITVWPMTTHEADDMIASAVATFKKQVSQIIIASPDKDLAQCVEGDKVILLDRRKKQLLNEEGVIRKFNIPPSSIPSYLALTGDNADGFPGVPGWGKKSSSLILKQYETLQMIPKYNQEWIVSIRGAKRLSQNFRDNYEEALLFQDLATLRTDIPISESLEDLEWKGVPKNRYIDFCDALGLRELKARPKYWMAEEN